MADELPPKAASEGGSIPPLLASSGPPVIAQSGSAAPPPAKGFWRARHLVAVVLSVGLALFLADALISAVDDTFILLFNMHVLAVVRGIVGFFTVLIGLVIYALMGITPMIPKRTFFLMALFSPLAALVALPCWIYLYGRIQSVIWVISIIQLLCAIIILRTVQGGFKLQMPLVPEESL